LKAQLNRKLAMYELQQLIVEPGISSLEAHGISLRRHCILWLIRKSSGLSS